MRRLHQHPIGSDIRMWLGYVEAILATGLCTALAWLLDSVLATPNLGLLYLTGVLFVAIRAGIRHALFASALSFLAFNFLFTEPRYTFFVAYQQDILTLIFFLLVATVTGHLAARIRHQIETVEASNERMSLLETFARRLTGIVDRKDLASVLVQCIRSTLAVEAVVLMRDHASRLTIVAGAAGPDGLTDSERAAAERAEVRREATGCGTDWQADLAWAFIPLLGKRGSLGVLGVRRTGSTRPLEREKKKLVLAMRDQASTALEKLLLATEMDRTRLAAEADKLRSALLSSVSHDLRTPLVSIKGAATALLELGDALSPGDRRALLENLLEESERLNRYVQNLLDMTRLGYGAVTPNRDWCDVRDVAGAAVRSLKSVLGLRDVQIDVEAGDELVFTDGSLLEQLLINLIENAARYSPADQPVRIEARHDLDEYEVSVCDRGEGIPVHETERVFEMFHRADTHEQSQSGSGMGLAICKGLAEALGGTIRIASRPKGSGTCVVLRLPRTDGAASLRSAGA